MVEIVAVLLSVVGLVPAVVLVVSGAIHIKAPGYLQSAIRQPVALRRLLSVDDARAAARVWGFVELASGAGAIILVLGQFSSSALLLVYLWLTLIYGGFAIWITLLRRLVEQPTCGCGPRDEPADRGAVGRALGLGSCTLTAAFGFQVGMPPALPPSSWVALFFAGVFAVIAWNLPSAVRQPHPTEN